MTDKEENRSYELIQIYAEEGDNKLSPPSSKQSNNRNSIVLEWSDITYTVPGADGGVKTLLHPMAGVAKPGELLAVMGTSGAGTNTIDRLVANWLLNNPLLSVGKSTLLDVLAGRIESKSLLGRVVTNGKPIDKKAFRKITGYVMQSDALFPLLTVRETFQYAAALRVHDQTKAEKMASVESIIKLLRLDTCAETIVVDDTNRGISGGEKRRVSIGVDIVHHPAVIFLDEPTSGLDSATAMSVVESLRAIAKEENSTIVMTIHQPSARLFSMIDSVIFLAVGHVTYNGPTNMLTNLINKIYSETGRGEPPIATPPELFIELCEELQLEGKLEMLFVHDSVFIREDANLIPTATASYANNLFMEIAVLSHRNLVNVMRTPDLFITQMITAIVFGVMLGTLLYNAGEDDEGLFHRSSYFIFTIAFFMYTALDGLPIFFAEREIFEREFSHGAYRAGSYTVSSLLVYVPAFLLQAVVFSCLTWFLVGLPLRTDVFFFHTFCVLSVMIAGQAFSTMFSVLVPTPIVGQSLGSSILAIMFLFSGFFILKDDIPDYWIWLHYLSLFKYGYDSMIVNATKDIIVTPEYTNEEVLELYSVEGVNKGTGVGVLWLFIIFFRLVFYYRLLTVFNGSRK